MRCADTGIRQYPDPAACSARTRPVSPDRPVVSDHDDTGYVGAALGCSGLDRQQIEAGLGSSNSGDPAYLLTL